MTTELEKLNSAQRATLKKLFSGRTATAIHVDEAISKVTVEFGRSVHFLMLGPRGGIIYHENRMKGGEMIDKTKPVNVVIGRKGRVDMQDHDPSAAARFWDLEEKIQEAKAALSEYQSQQDAVVVAFRNSMDKSK